MAILIGRGWPLIVVLISIHRGWAGWMASLTQWRGVWVDSGSWWWTGRPGVLWSMGSWRVGRDWATELNWTELNWIISGVHPLYICWLAICISSLKNGLCRASGSGFLMTVVVMMVVAAGVWQHSGWSIWQASRCPLSSGCTERPMKFPWNSQCCVGTGIDLGKQKERWKQKASTGQGTMQCVKEINQLGVNRQGLSDSQFPPQLGMKQKKIF